MGQTAGPACLPKSKRRVAGNRIPGPMIGARFARARWHSGHNKQDCATQADIEGRAPTVRRDAIPARQSLHVFDVFVDHATQTFMRFQKRIAARREIKMGAHRFPPITAAFDIAAEKEGRCWPSVKIFRVFGHSRCASLRPKERDADDGQARPRPGNRSQKARAPTAREPR